MGCCGCSDEPSSKVDPRTPDDGHATSRRSEQVFVTNRSCTDILPLIFMIALFGVFGYLMTNAVQKGDIYRVINGYDNCGYVCDRVTKHETNLTRNCPGGDMRGLRYLRMSVNEKGVSSRECVSNCSDQVVFLNRCVPKDVSETTASVIRKLGLENIYKEVSMDLSVAWRELVYLLIIALVFSLGILIAFRYMVQTVVYIVLVGVVLVCIGGTTYLWLAWYNEKKAVEAHQIPEADSSVQPYFIYAILISVLTVITLLIILVMRTRIALVMQLFREAGKAVYAMPALLLQPIYTYVLIGVTVCAWIYAMLWIESAGNIYLNRKDHVHFRKDGALGVTRWYNLFLFYVTCEFLLGCQHMVVALAVARWFFTRDKKRLSLAVTRGFGYLVAYHLGTVAFGSIMIGLVRVIRAMCRAIQHRMRQQSILGWALSWCCECCMGCCEFCLKLLTRNAYIETAIYGCNFCTGGRKAFQALSSNILRVGAINSVGDFVLFLGKVFVVTLTVVAGIYLIQKKEGLHHPWVPIAVAGIFAFLVSHCFISIYEMIIDTIFLCFCEDCEVNDGISRPYFMSRGLMEFVENSKKALQHAE